MSSLSRIFSTSVLTFAGVLALSGCSEGPIDDPTLDDDEDGISIDDEGETSDPPPDLPDPDDGEDPEDGGETGPTCESTTAIASNIPPNVVLVLDKSRSMVNYSWDDDAVASTPDVTRWHSLHGTVDTIANQYEQGMSLGLTMFPSAEATSAFEDACLVSSAPEVATGLGNAQAILAAIPAADDVDLYGATPAAAGVATALAHLETLEDGRPAAMILVTDGAANCSLDAEGGDVFAMYDEDLPLIVADAWERAGIPTYVIGIDIESESQAPYTNPREKLDEVARLGGVPWDGEVGFYDATNAETLMSALDEIASSVSCTIELGKAPTGPDELVVTVDGQVIPRVDSCDDGDGWIYSDPDGSLDSIELCNAACDAMLETGEIEAEFLCPPQP